MAMCSQLGMTPPGGEKGLRFTRTCPTCYIWATDYPHPDGFFPGAPAMIADKLSEKHKRQVLADSAIQFYNLT